MLNNSLQSSSLHSRNIVFKNRLNADAREQLVSRGLVVSRLHVVPLCIATFPGCLEVGSTHLLKVNSFSKARHMFTYKVYGLYHI
jgi:hypothetical protein